MTPIDYAILACLVAVVCAILLLTLLFPPMADEPFVKVHPEVLSDPKATLPFHPIAEDRGRELHLIVKTGDRRSQ